ncbi:MAG: CHASE2 domain-containing protein [bacterium]
MKNKKSLLYIILSWFILSSLYYLGALERGELNITNYYFSLRKPLLFSKDIVVIGITDDCLKEIGQWPWPRVYHAKLLEVLKNAKASVIGFDILFSEPDREGGDNTLSIATKDANNVIYAAYLDLERGALYQPIPIIERNSCGIGHINITPASNGFIYSLPLSLSLNRKRIMAFSYQVSRLYLQESLKNFFIKPNNDLLINYSGKRIQIIPYIEVIRGEIPLSFFNRKLVLVGITAKGLGDYYLAPSYRELIPGVEIQANAINTILSGRFLQKIPKTSNILISTLSLVFIILFLFKLDLKKGIIVTLASIIGYLTISFILFISNGIIVTSLLPPITMGASFGVYEVMSHLEEIKERENLKNIFKLYLAPEVLEKILVQPNLLNLKGEEVEVTIMFADISGFTKFSQQFPPQIVVRYLNEYLGMMSRFILENRGTLDKFIGDAVMAIYGAPIKCNDHHLKALDTAIKIIEESKKRDLKVKIGINTGRVILGNIGTEMRVQYTAVGDAVNLASYLESIADPGEILIGEATYRAIQDKIIAEEIILRDKYNGTKAYKVIGWKA